MYNFLRARSSVWMNGFQPNLALIWIPFTLYFKCHYKYRPNNCFEITEVKMTRYNIINTINLKQKEIFCKFFRFSLGLFSEALHYSSNHYFSPIQLTTQTNIGDSRMKPIEHCNTCSIKTGTFGLLENGGHENIFQIIKKTHTFLL